MVLLELWVPGSHPGPMTTTTPGRGVLQWEPSKAGGIPSSESPGSENRSHQRELSGYRQPCGGNSQAGQGYKREEQGSEPGTNNHHGPISRSTRLHK